MEMTSEDIQRSYNAAMDSVNLLNGPKPTGMSDADWADCVRRNVEHLEIMVAKDYWEGQDLTPLTDAIAANK
jgi:hypothetical protein